MSSSSNDEELAARLDEALRENQREERDEARQDLERQAQTAEKLAAALAKDEPDAG